MSHNNSKISSMKRKETTDVDETHKGKRKRASSLSSLIQPTSQSPFRKLKMSCSISLPPVYIGRAHQGVQEILNSKLLKYDERFSGVLLAYGKPQLAEGFGRVLNELPELSYLVKFDALCFVSPVGMRLKGHVNRVTSGHIGLLVCGAFQASIASDKVGEKYRFSSSKGRWMHREKKNVIIKEGVDVWFKVCAVRQKSGAVHIDGSIEEANLGPVTCAKS